MNVFLYPHATRVPLFKDIAVNKLLNALSKPTVFVVIALCNKGKYIERALSSVRVKQSRGCHSRESRNLVKRVDSVSSTE